MPQRGDRKAFAATDYLYMSGTILVAVIILSFSVAQHAFDFSVREIDNTMGTMKQAINTLLTLGPYSSDTIFITVPPIIEIAQLWNNPNDETDGNSVVILTINKQQHYYDFGYPVSGNVNFLQTPGTYYITFYNDGEEIDLVRCGDSIINGPEQCEQNSDCPLVKPTCAACVCTGKEEGGGGPPGGGGGKGGPKK